MPNVSRKTVDLPKTFSRVLREAREGAGITQAALAERMGVAPPTVCRWELGANLSETTIRRYAEALGMKVRLELR